MNLYTYATYAFIPLCFPSSTNTFIDSYFFWYSEIFSEFSIFLQLFYGYSQQFLALSGHFLVFLD